jgi:hypothetical protein
VNPSPSNPALRPPMPTITPQRPPSCDRSTASHAADITTTHGSPTSRPTGRRTGSSSSSSKQLLRHRRRLLYQPTWPQPATHPAGTLPKRPPPTPEHLHPSHIPAPHPSTHPATNRARPLIGFRLGWGRDGASLAGCLGLGRCVWAAGGVDGGAVGPAAPPAVNRSVGRSVGLPGRRAVPAGTG